MGSGSIHIQNVVRAQVTDALPSTTLKQPVYAGQLVLPQGQTITLQAGRSPSEPILIPPVEAIDPQHTTTFQARLLPAGIRLLQEGPAFDQAIIQHIRVLKSEWREQSQSSKDQPEKRQKKRLGLFQAIIQTIFSNEKEEAPPQPKKLKKGAVKKRGLTRLILALFKK